MIAAAAAESPGGTWEAGSRYAEMKASVREKVEVAIATLGFVKRQVLRSVLIGATAPCARVEISRSATDLTITCDSFTPATAPTDGEEVAFTGDDGRNMRLTHWIDDNGDVVQTFLNRHGTRSNRFALLPDGGLRVSVSLSAPALGQPLAYSLDYH